MFEKIYYVLHRRASKKKERGSYSSGYLQAKIRDAALSWCKGRSGSALEVGCGEGLFLDALLRENPLMVATGVDTDDGRVRQALERCCPRGRVRIILQNGSGLSFSDGSFDTVVCVNVFLNCAGIAVVKRMISEISRVCKKGGRIIVEFRNKWNLPQKIKFRMAPWYDKTVRCLSLETYDCGEIRCCFAQEGCRVLRTKALAGWGRFAPVLMMEAQKL